MSGGIDIICSILTHFLVLMTGPAAVKSRLIILNTAPVGQMATGHTHVYKDIPKLWTSQFDLGLNLYVLRITFT